MIRTERLVLREWVAADREPFAELCADPVVMEHFPAPLTREQADAFAARVEAHFAEHGFGLWAVEVDGRFAGFDGLMWTDVLGGRDLEVGWRLERWAWGHGYATEAAAAALRFGLQHAPEVLSFTAVVNERSWRVMERLGMRRVREFDHPRVAEGSPIRRHVLYSTR